MFHQAADDLRKVVRLHDPQTQQLSLEAHILREILKTLDCSGVDFGNLDLDFGLGGLPSAHLIPADNTAVADESYTVAALLHFAQQMRIQKDGRATIALL